MIALDLLVQLADRHSVEERQVCVQNHSLLTQQQYASLHREWKNLRFRHAQKSG